MMQSFVVRVMSLKETLPGDSIFIKDQRYRQISDCHSNAVMDLFMETRSIALLYDFYKLFQVSLHQTHFPSCQEYENVLFLRIFADD